MGKKRSRLPACFYASAIVVLAAGLLSAALIYVFAADDAVHGLAGGKQYDLQVQRIGGQAAVLAVRFSQWLGGLWHGRQLAYTVAAMSIGVALACVLIARSLSFDLSFKPGKGRDDSADG